MYFHTHVLLLSIEITAMFALRISLYLEFREGLRHADHGKFFLAFRGIRICIPGNLSLNTSTAFSTMLALE